MAGEGTILTSREKYAVINEVIRKYQLKNTMRYLCELTGVSRSGCYAWLQNSEKHAIRDEQDYQDYLLIRCIYDAFKGKMAIVGSIWH